MTAEPRRRRTALAVVGLMTAIWIVLTGFSFVESRGQVTPESVTFRGKDAVEGKRVFQAYNCMGCHAIVGNGAYFAPDLTTLYKDAGPAFIAAFLPSASTWPTRAAVELQIDKMREEGALDVIDAQDYFERFPGALKRVEQRGGKDALMPNLPLAPDEIDALIAFLKYTSEMDREGWPPEVRARPEKVDEVGRRLRGEAAPSAPAVAEPAPDPAKMTPAQRGRQLASDLGCFACHSTGAAVKVGPGWKGLYGRVETLSDGTTVTVDDAYIARSVREPAAQVVKGFQNVMPPYAGKVSDDQLRDLIEYIKTLK